MQYNPDIAIIGFHPYSLERNLLSFRGYAKPHFDIHKKGFYLSNCPVVAPDKLRKSLMFRPRLFNYIEMTWAKMAEAFLLGEQIATSNFIFERFPVFTLNIIDS